MISSRLIEIEYCAPQFTKAEYENFAHQPRLEKLLNSLRVYEARSLLRPFVNIIRDLLALRLEARRARSRTESAITPNCQRFFKGVQAIYLGREQVWRSRNAMAQSTSVNFGRSNIT